MAIRELTTIEVADVEVNDQYFVELRQLKKRTIYSAKQARDLANELIEAADRSDALIAEDAAASGIRMEHALLINDAGEVVL
ncbi:hypothetical protein ACFWHR_04000 [Leucobacter sp. NPDC058333]|uniref:hypothetical protein n=1 Tax=Leucobacter sp. NPDC058333 TaxID=3346450 RepID=UPI00365CC767